MTTKELSRKQVIVPMSNDNKIKFILDSSAQEYKIGNQGRLYLIGNSRNHYHYQQGYYFFESPNHGAICQECESN